jgi:hypothetical protein
LGLPIARLRPRFLPSRYFLAVLFGEFVLLAAALLIITIDVGPAPSATSDDDYVPFTLLEPPQGALEMPIPSLQSVEADVRHAIEASESDVGMALIGPEGAPVLSIAADEPFVLASVSKLYLLVAYLDRLYQTEQKPSDADMAVLQPMIQSSDNDSATAIWTRIGGEEGLLAFLASKGLPPVQPVEEDAWGTLQASPAQVADLLWRLESGTLLDPESTQLAKVLLSDIVFDQSWGVSAGADQPSTEVFLKNGWYPETEGWRVNSAGIIQARNKDYVLVIFSYPNASLEEAIVLLESVAAPINDYMTRDAP